ncbi:LuxE/PaaK family acyltransferase [Desulfobacula sp.]|uniref:LuxE/PaaK family acyltransferase n=1 Tax=Desulfobacula sp. TaxID=2593537 RepID=UPI00271502C5|nr:hypothetical protein [Desulfobacula sp.]
MSELIKKKPYEKRDDILFLQELNNLTEYHLKGCKDFFRIWANWKHVDNIYDIPFLHVGIFKYLTLKTQHSELTHKRTVSSSSTSGVPSKIILDERSSKLQSLSTTKTLMDFLGEKKKPLLVIDSVRSLRSRSGLSARMAAAMSLRPLANDIQFLLDDPDDYESIKWDLLEENIDLYDEFIVYGFSWILWLAWVKNKFPTTIQKILRNKKIYFVHSGGWKKLESIKVSHEHFNTSLLDNLHSDSKVIDFYGLVEQIGIIYPLCECGARHVPVWADVIVRDSYTLKPLENGEIGQLQLLNCITFGAPYYSVLTEDLGRILTGSCSVGRSGKRFELIGRVPKAEIRGCANV